MKKPYYIDGFKKVKLLMDEWLNTPYRHGVMVKNGGADCAFLIGYFLKETGVVKNIYYPDHDKKWYYIREQEIVLEGFRKNFAENLSDGFSVDEFSFTFGERKSFDFIRGDILIFSTVPSGVSNHVAMWVGEDNQIYNSLENHGTIYMSYGSFWDKKLTYLFRVMKDY